DILNTTIDRPTVTETTAMGAAFLAGLSAGVYSSLDDVNTFWCLDQTFKPNMDDTTRTQYLSGWDNAVERTLTNGKY
ncbi:MAG: glycerol kinase, partial [Sphingomonadales bacterium]|nr:glycerol kinase [Sphingomonadales bacterium]